MFKTHIPITGLALFAANACFAQDLLVSSLLNHEVLRYNASTGQFVETFIPFAQNGGLDQPHAILERCDDILVASFGTDNILRYDRQTGAFLDVFIDNSNGLDNPTYMLYGPDDNLYISSQGSDEILRYTPRGVFIDAFVTAGSGGLDGPSGFAFGPDGRLYVAGRFSADVLAYNGTSGAFDEVIADATDGLGSGNTFGLNFADNGDLYFASNGNVFRYDLDTDAIVATIPVSFPIGIEPGPSGNIFVATSNNLRVIDTSDDSISPLFLSGGVVNTLNFFRFANVPGTPDPPDCVPVLSRTGFVALMTLVLGVGVLVQSARRGAG